MKSEVRRLDPQDWVRVAFDLLAEQGIDGVRVEPLAKLLSVTKGSFYWHFKDRDALLAALLGQWRREATLNIIESLESGHQAAADRLKQLLRLPFESSRPSAHVELSIRLWGRRDPRARETLQEVDGLRLRYIEKLLGEVGFSKAEATPRAVYAYSFMRVAGTLIRRQNEELIDACVETLLTR